MSRRAKARQSKTEVWAIRFLSVAGAGICAALALVAVQYAVANTYLYRAQYALLIDREGQPTAQQLARAKRNVDQAIHWAADDANNLDLAGRINYHLALQEPDSEKRSSRLNDSRIAHSQALSQRQHWPYAFTGLVLAKSASGEIDQDFLYSLTSAIRFGQHNAGISRELIPPVLRRWHQLPAPLKRESLAMIEQTMQEEHMPITNLRKLLKRERRYYQICSQLSQFEHKQQLCNSPLPKPGTNPS